MDFATKYRRLLHAEFDELLDADDKIYVAGPSYTMNKPALSRRVAHKWAFDEIVRANSKVKFGREEVIETMHTSIEMFERIVAKSNADSAKNNEEKTTTSENYRASIAHIEAFILKL